MIKFTQGDTPVLNMTAKDGDGNPFDLTSATFITRIKGANGVIVEIPNSQHEIVDEDAGTFTISLTSANTSACGAGEGKDIITEVTQTPNITTFRGIGILSVYTENPNQ